MTMGFYVPTNKDVKFPKACEQCYFYDGLLCCVLDTYIHDPENKQEDCPLIPVPPHGRLIDADAYEKLLRGLGNRDYRREAGTLQDAIKFLHPHYAPTIIPAEEGKT